MTWVNRKVEEMDEMAAFLDRQQGHSAFLWTPPRQDVARKFICEEGYEYSPESYGQATLTATFREVHDV